MATSPMSKTPKSSRRSSPPVRMEDQTASGATMLSKDNAVLAWLQFLQMDRYAQDFLDNGYDDLETAKRIGREDLDAIGVQSPHHKAFLLDAVRVLREQGAVWVYLLQEEQRQACHAQQLMNNQLLLRPDEEQYDSCGERISAGSSGMASGNSSSIPWNDNEFGSGEGSSSTSSGGSSSSRPRSSGMTATGTPAGRVRAIRSSPGGGGQPGSPALRHCTTVELTPEHHRATMRQQQQQQQLAATPKRQQQQQLNNTSTDDEDLIQRVSDVQLGSNSEAKKQQHQSRQKRGRNNGGVTKMIPSSSSTNSSSHPNSPTNNCSPLKILLGERLSGEGVQLNAPPFTSKVRTSSISKQTFFSYKHC